ncbi:MAG TPA: PVC-type heme-binding CxxCH protein, partial [Gemmataceae bacterium]|nr:PVC-type heme-binding CxxCH protein [Gemmataceae bacterium]
QAQQPLTAGGFTVLGKPPGKVQSQDMGAFPKGSWQDGDQLWWTGAKPGDKLTLVIPIKEEGTYQVSIILTRARDYGIVQLSLDGVKAGKPIDLYNPDVIPTGPIPLGTHKLAKGNHSLGVEIVGANAKADKAYMVGIDYLVFRPTEPKASTFTYPKSLYPYVSLAPEAAAKAMRLPKGFSVQVAAAEPDVKQPIAMAFDDRGRLWVAEAYEYPIRAKGDKGRDRILIFEDTKGTGKFDKRTVFIDNLNLVSGLEVGFGGVWVGAAPYLLYIPIKEGEDKPAGPPKVLLDGWGYHDTHETLNTFIWGPDGWLYGCHGVFTHSLVGKPGTPKDKRVPLNAAIWRYHPLRHQFEVFAEGTSNPWGIDFNDHGQAFATACVIPHMFHIIQGARYARQAGNHFNPFTYADIPTVADHLHYLGNQWNVNDRKRSDDLGGGHAHAGAMVYLGGSWPAEYRNQIFMNNIHGNRINLDLLKPKSSGFIASHGPDFILTDDQSSQILNLRYGPDGQVWMIDWYDRNQCHHNNPAGHDRTNGRIFRVSCNDAKPVKVNLAKLSDVELVKLQLHNNDWYVRHARRLLQERAGAALERDLKRMDDGTLPALKDKTSNSIVLGRLDKKVYEELTRIALNHADETRRLRAMWALNVTNGLELELAHKLMASDRPYVRAWAIQLLVGDKNRNVVGSTLEKLAQMARKDPSPVVRLYIASALQRLPLQSRWPILEGLTSHSEDATDHNLPLMYWYAMEPLAGKDMRRALALALVAGENIPLLQNFMIRRIGSSNVDKALTLLVEGLGEAMDENRQLAFLRGMNRALVGRRTVAAPKGWAGIYPELGKSRSKEVRLQATALAVTFEDKEAVASVRKILTDTKADLASRRFALNSLQGAGVLALVDDLHQLLDDEAMRGDVLRGLAHFDDLRVAGVILRIYPRLPLAEKRDALATLCSRASYAQNLLTAIQKKQVPSTDLTADLVRQLRDLKNEKLDQRIKDIWGSVRESSEEFAKLIADTKAMLRTAPKEPADPILGRALFAKTCQQCHTLYGIGGKVGPDITGSNRADLDYLLSNIIDPSAVMAKEYQPSIVRTLDGRTITGIVKDQSDNAVTLQTANEIVVLPRKEIDVIRQSKSSMMPNDLLKPLSEHEVRSLVAYLSGRGQTPMLATPDNVASFFNGQDLTGWRSARGQWRVNKGEMIATGPEEKNAPLLVSDLVAADFHLTLELNPGKNGQGAIVIRAEETTGLPPSRRPTIRFSTRDGRIGGPGGEFKDGEGADSKIRADSWNKLDIFAVGNRLVVYLNGKKYFEYEKIYRYPRRGLIALEGSIVPGQEIRFRNLQLKLLPGKEK